MGEAANASGILVVDDDLDTAQMFAMLLQELGHAVEYVTRPQPVLEIAKRMKPWLIFLDIGLPDFDGRELAGRLRKLPGLEQTKIIAITGGPASARDGALAAGCDDFLRKPVPIDVLESLIKTR